MQRRTDHLVKSSRLSPFVFFFLLFSMAPGYGQETIDCQLLQQQLRDPGPLCPVRGRGTRTEFMGRCQDSEFSGYKCVESTCKAEYKDRVITVIEVPGIPPTCIMCKVPADKEATKIKLCTKGRREDKCTIPEEPETVKCGVRLHCDAEVKKNDKGEKTVECKNCTETDRPCEHWQCQ